MSVEYFLGTDLINRIERSISIEFLKIKSLSLPTKKQLWEFFGFFIWLIDYGEDDEEEQAEFKRYLKEIPLQGARVLLIFIVGLIVVSGIYKNVYILFVGFIISPVIVYIIFWFPYRFLSTFIRLLERGPKGIIATIGFLLFFISSMLSIYLVLTRKQ